MIVLLPIVIGLSIIIYLMSKPYLLEHKRNNIKKLPFKKEWRKIIQKRMPYFKQMPTDLQLQLKQHIQVFIAEKEFVGCNGVEITDEIKITIAAQACLLLLNRKTNYYPKLKTILIYPGAFTKVQNQQAVDGTQQTKRINLSGESWDFGKVVLSWQDSVHGAELPHDGHNVVIHEFAHQLDQENGRANGAPTLGKEQNYQSWSDTFSKQFKLLQRQAAANIPSLFDYYGATNPAEFFAVVSEVFFEKSEQFAKEHPELYQQLTGYYKVDPIHW
ncbi:M90 family metallopeptidase [Colwellia sp. E2M01]|uniref:M90 family metallopeptidase n=1 Tax=Colwellia sp. E2M01 TaxID=2841561 RepID=UPI001C098956|nr:M90 family metallopeptidase [Colwellia sp. E2M01]MBU2872332.1 zinc-dependent peptidase [Colwellia sp. E2M01]